MTNQRNIPDRVTPGSGQESVWDYPRPPRIVAVRRRLRVVLGGVTIADTIAGWRVLETSHPPNYYFPRSDVRPDALTAEARSSWCEWKGQAGYYTVRGGDRIEPSAAWSYETPSVASRELAGMVAFYPALMDECIVDDETASAQPGGFYGGWITNDIVGPFKGAPGTSGW